jgi:hypothetical protein
MAGNNTGRPFLFLGISLKAGIVFKMVKRFLTTMALEISK